MTASQQPTGHDKAVQIVAGLVHGDWHNEEHLAEKIVSALRAALAAGDPDVAEAFDIPSLLAAAKAEALRDTADDWQQGDWIMVLPTSLGPKVIGLGQRVTDWLRAQADRAEA